MPGSLEGFAGRRQHEILGGHAIAAAGLDQPLSFVLEPAG